MASTPVTRLTQGTMRARLLAPTTTASQTTKIAAILLQEGHRSSSLLPPSVAAHHRWAAPIMPLPSRLTTSATNQVHPASLLRPARLWPER